MIATRRVFFQEGGLVDEHNAFDDPVLIVDKAFPVTTGCDFRSKTLRSLQFANIADSSAFPQMVKVFASGSLIEFGVLHRTLVDEVERLLQEGGTVRGGVRIFCPENGIQT